MKKLLLLIAMVSIGAAAYAQEADKSKFELHPGVMIQAWSGYYNIGDSTKEQMGFGVKRFRLYAKPTLTDKLSGFFQIEAAQSLTSLAVEDTMRTEDFLSTFRLLHANLDYKINDEFTLTVGKFIGAGMMGAGLLSSKNIDLIDRPEAAVTWAKETAGADFADYGAEVTMKQKFGLTTRLWFHNGNVNKNVTSGKGSANKSIALDFWTSYKPAFAPAVEFGGSIGKGNQYVVDQFNYTGFLYVSPAPFRFKAEYATVENYDVNRKFQG
ncbi:MAG TPA: porin, partial [Ignavibacteriales bacterium]|nr:porin [Ignavibacteriales bacterium]